MIREDYPGKTVASIIPRKKTCFEVQAVELQWQGFIEDCNSFLQQQQQQQQAMALKITSNGQTWVAESDILHRMCVPLLRSSAKS